MYKLLYSRNLRFVPIVLLQGWCRFAGWWMHLHSRDSAIGGQSRQCKFSFLQQCLYFLLDDWWGGRETWRYMLGCWFYNSRLHFEAFYDLHWTDMICLLLLQVYGKCGDNSTGYSEWWAMASVIRYYCRTESHRYVRDDINTFSILPSIDRSTCTACYCLRIELLIRICLGSIIFQLITPMVTGPFYQTKLLKF